LRAEFVPSLLLFFFVLAFTAAPLETATPFTPSPVASLSNWLSTGRVVAFLVVGFAAAFVVAVFVVFAVPVLVVLVALFLAAGVLAALVLGAVFFVVLAFVVLLGTVFFFAVLPVVRRVVLAVDAATPPSLAVLRPPARAFFSLLSCCGRSSVLRWAAITSA